MQIEQKSFVNTWNNIYDLKKANTLLFDLFLMKHVWLHIKSYVILIHD